MRNASENATFVCRSYSTANAPASLSATSCIRSSSASRRSAAEADSAERLYRAMSDIDTRTASTVDHAPVLRIASSGPDVILFVRTISESRSVRRTVQSQRPPRSRRHQVTQRPPSSLLRVSRRMSLSTCSAVSRALPRTPPWETSTCARRRARSSTSAVPAAATGHDGRRRTRPVARVAHRRELPLLELVRRQLGDALQRALQTQHEILRRLHRRKGFAQQALKVGGGLSHQRLPHPPRRRAPPAA